MLLVVSKILKANPKWDNANGSQISHEKKKVITKNLVGGTGVIGVLPCLSITYIIFPFEQKLPRRWGSLHYPLGQGNQCSKKNDFLHFFLLCLFGGAFEFRKEEESSQDEGISSAFVKSVDGNGC
jgi:hypothetical protein